MIFQLITTEIGWLLHLQIKKCRYLKEMNKQDNGPKIMKFFVKVQFGGPNSLFRSLDILLQHVNLIQTSIFGLKNGAIQMIILINLSGVNHQNSQKLKIKLMT